MRSAKDIFSLIVKEIKDGINKNGQSVSYDNHGIRNAMGNGGDASSNAIDVINNIQDTVTNISNAIEGTKLQILSGGDVIADDNPSEYVNVYPTEVIIGGQSYKTTVITRIKVLNNTDRPLIKPCNVYIVIAPGNIVTLTTSIDDNSAVLAKIVLPYSQTAKIGNKKVTASYDGYIVLRKSQFFEEDFVIDEDTYAELVKLTEVIFANNIFGSLTLSEQLKIVNRDGSLNMDSKSITIKYPSGNVGVYIDKTGIFFYNDQKQLLSYFSANRAKIGGIVITPESLESDNYVSGTSGFQINRTGNAEFNNVTVRGEIEATTGTIGGIDILAHSIRSSNYVTGVSGFNIDDDGDAEFDKITIRGATGDAGGISILDHSIQSVGFVSGNTGFQIKDDGTAQFNSVTIQGTVTATAGSIGGITVDGTTLHSSNYVAGTTGFNLGNSGSAEFNNVTVRGTIEATAGLIGLCEIDADGIKSANWPTSGFSINGTLGTFGLKGNPFGAGSQAIELNASGAISVKSNSLIWNVADYASIQATINDIPSLVGGTIYFPSGVWDLSGLQVLVNKNNISFYGAGRGTVLKFNLPDSGGNLYVTGNNFEMSDLTCCFLIGGTSSGRCIIFSDGSIGGKIHNCTFNTSGTCTPGAPNTFWGIIAQTGVDNSCIIEDCIFDTQNGANIGLVANTSRFHRNKSIGSAADQGIETTASAVVGNNYIGEEIKSSGSWANIHIYNNNVSGIDIGCTGGNAIVSNNIVGNLGIESDGVSNLVVTGNIVGTGGIITGGSTAVARALIHGNVVNGSITGGTEADNIEY